MIKEGTASAQSGPGGQRDVKRTGVRGFRIGTIRTRLFFAFVSVVLLLAVVLGAAVAVLGFRNARQQATKQLETVATLKGGEIRKWARDSQFALAGVLDTDSASRYLHWLAEEDPQDPLHRVAHQRVQEGFRRAINQGRWFRELVLLDHEGVVVAATDRTEEGEDYSNQIFFQEGLKHAYMQPPAISPALPRMSIAFAQPVMDRKGRSFVLVGRTSAGVLEEIMLGQTSRPSMPGRLRSRRTRSAPRRTDSRPSSPVRATRTWSPTFSSW